MSGIDLEEVSGVTLTSKNDVIEKVKEAYLSIDEKIEKDEVILSILDGPTRYSTFTKGNFSAIIGKAKSKKTFLISLFMASFLKGGSLQEKIYSKKGKVIYFDTEQSKGDVRKVQDRVVELATNNDMFQVYVLRRFAPSVRLEIIDYVLQKNKTVDFVVIDGIRDLLSDINNADQATELVTKLMEWTYDYNIHICTVIHQNKGDTNARGHLGTEIMNKAQSVIRVTKDPDNDDCSIVESEVVRGFKDFKPFKFQIQGYLPKIIDYDGREEETIF